jgi:hypothetical protein
MFNELQSTGQTYSEVPRHLVIVEQEFLDRGIPSYAADSTVSDEQYRLAKMWQYPGTLVEAVIALLLAGHISCANPLQGIKDEEHVQ